MSKPDYFHLLPALFFLSGGVLYTFSQRLFGRAPRWPLLYGGCAMSPFSRWLAFSVGSAFALWEFALVFFDLEPSLTMVAISVISLVLLVAAYRHDRRLGRTKTNVE